MPEVLWWVWYLCWDEPNVELVIAVRRYLVFAGSHDRHTVLTHQPTDGKEYNLCFKKYFQRLIKR
jgi:hypothetical protein